MPTGRNGKAYEPESVVGVLRVRPVDWFATVTVAFGTTAPVESVTVPVICPLADCAYPVAAKIEMHNMAAASVCAAFMAERASSCGYTTLVFTRILAIYPKKLLRRTLAGLFSTAYARGLRHTSTVNGIA